MALARRFGRVSVKWILSGPGAEKERRTIFGLSSTQGRTDFPGDHLGPSFRDIGAAAVPYSHNFELPTSVRSHLPEHAQDIYRAAFNHVFDAHMGDPRQEEAAHRIAWAAVKRRYVKKGDQWVERT